MLFWTHILEYIKICPSPISKLSPEALFCYIGIHYNASVFLHTRFTDSFFTKFQTNTLVTGGEDSLLCLWSAEEQQTSSPSKVRTRFM